ncbi:MAG: trk system potassium uptake protein TrkH [Flavobacteriales bacterium]
MGASSSSTGGGIKTSSFFIIVASALATIKNQKQISFAKRNIPVDLVNKALSIFIFSFGGITIFTFFLCISEMESLKDGTMTIMDVFFEEVSAFSTVGLSLGITSKLSTCGKILVMVSMFIGRIGTLTLAFALSKSSISRNYKYPRGHLMVG